MLRQWHRVTPTPLLGIVPPVIVETRAPVHGIHYKIRSTRWTGE